MIIEAARVAEDQAWAQGYEGRVDMAAIIDILQEMNSKLFAQHRLQPVPSQLVARGTDQVDQILAKSQNVCRIEGGLVVAWRWLVQIGLKKGIQEHGPRGAVPPCA